MSDGVCSLNGDSINNCVEIANKFAWWNIRRERKAIELFSEKFITRISINCSSFLQADNVIIKITHCYTIVHVWSSAVFCNMLTKCSNCDESFHGHLWKVLRQPLLHSSIDQYDIKFTTSKLFALESQIDSNEFAVAANFTCFQAYNNTVGAACATEGNCLWIKNCFEFHLLICFSMKYFQRCCQFTQPDDLVSTT